MNRVLAAPFAEFFKFQFSFHQLSVFLSIVIYPLTHRALKFCYFFLRFHIFYKFKLYSSKPPHGFSRCDPNLRFGHRIEDSRFCSSAKRRQNRRNREPTVYPDILKILPKPAVGIEPTTYCLQNSCSATELRWQNFVRISRILDFITKFKMFLLIFQ